MSLPKNTASNTIADNMNCPCGIGKPYAHCCGIFIRNQKKPETPEALMRSRYTAYTQANIDYITRTMKGPAKLRFDPKRAYRWAKQVEWLKLEIITTSTQFSEGVVEFIAYFKEQGKINTMHEISHFHYENGEWYYVDGKHR